MTSVATARRGVRLRPSDLGWWCWVASGVLFAAWLAGAGWAFWGLLALTGLQIVGFRLRDGRFGAFRVQVRIAYGLLVVCTAWKPLHGLAYVPAVGTWAEVIFGYCALARLLALMPWNRGEPLTWRLAWRTFAAPPAPGAANRQPRLHRGALIS